MSGEAQGRGRIRAQAASPVGGGQTALSLRQDVTEAERDRLRTVLSLPREARTDSDVAWVLGRMNEYGCLDYARQVAHGLAGAARYEFSSLYGHLPDSRDKRFLEALPVWVIERN